MSGYDSIFREDLLRDRVIFVTGGGTGLGRCTAHELAALGATVVIGARRRDVLEKAAAEIAEGGGRCDVVEVNIRDEQSVDAAVVQIVEQYGRIDGLFNNAGGQFVAPVEKMSPNAWRSVIDLNLNGTFLVSTAVHRHSMAERGGAIVNMLADIWTGYPGMAHMAAARAGIENLTRTLSMEWGTQGIRVNCVAPGTILSSGLLTYPEPVQQRTVKDASTAPLGRLGTESEVSAAVVFLLSPAAAYITGETLKVDGGASHDKGRLMQVGGTPNRAWNGFHLRPDVTGTPFAKLEDESS